MEGPCSWYWSSSPVEDYEDVAFSVSFNDGGVYYGLVDVGKHVRCVR